MVNEIFTTDFDKEQFNILIIACQGGIKSSITCIGDYKPSYHELIGALEFMKLHMVAEQREKNKPAAEEFHKRSTKSSPRKSSPKKLK